MVPELSETLQQEMYDGHVVYEEPEQKREPRIPKAQD